MLSALSVRDVVLIDKLNLGFQKGLCVFTGETGAGKSILLDSLSLVLGARADAGLVRHGQPQLTVTATFSLPPEHTVFQLLHEQGINAAESEELILRRLVTADGKSKAFINDEPVSIAFLKNIGDLLAEIHGQFASHGLLNTATHLDVLDSYARLNTEKEAVAKAYTHFKEAESALKTAQMKLESVQNQEEYLRNAVIDLENLSPKPDETEELTQQRTRLMNSEKIITCVNQTAELLNNEQQGMIRQAAQAERQLLKAAQYDPDTFENMLQTLNEAQSVLSELSFELDNLGEKLGDVSELPEIDNRLYALKDAARRYQVDVNELPGLLDVFREKLANLEKGEEMIAQLQQNLNQAHADYLKAARILSGKRKKAADSLDKAVKKELPAVKLEKATFLTQITTDETVLSPQGIDSVCFTASTNKGTPPSLLHKIASGGELARFMLALKVVLAHTGETETLIFDEVDSGIGGATAAAVGDRLARLGKDYQVLVVTHSPQVASCGQTHYCVTKTEKNNETQTFVQQLSYSQRLQEIARMLSGTHITQTAQTMAQELLEKSCQNHPKN